MILYDVTTIPEERSRLEAVRIVRSIARNMAAQHGFNMFQLDYNSCCDFLWAALQGTWGKMLEIEVPYPEDVQA